MVSSSVLTGFFIAAAAELLFPIILLLVLSLKKKDFSSTNVAWLCGVLYFSTMFEDSAASGARYAKLVYDVRAEYHSLSHYAFRYSGAL